MIYTLRDELHGAYLRALRNYDPYEIEYIDAATLLCRALLMRQMIPTFDCPLLNYRSKWPHRSATPIGFEGEAWGYMYFTIYFFPEHCEVYSKLKTTSVLWKLDLVTFEWDIV